MSADLISVVIPTHNRAHLLPRLLACVLAQDDDDFEVLVVDDGSSDETPHVLAACDDQRLRTARHEHARGVSVARNTGTSLAHGRWVAWCDDDDVWAPQKLRLQRQALERSPGLLWCNTGTAHVSANLRLRAVQLSPPAGDIAARMLQTNWITGGGSGVMAERKAVLGLGGFDSQLSIYADWHMWARLARLSPLAVVDAPLVGYVAHRGGMSHDRSRLLEELAVLRSAFDEIAGGAPTIDEMNLGRWMLQQQASDGRFGETATMAWQLLHRRMVQPWRVPFSMLGAVAPPGIRRRWARRRSLTDPRRRGYQRIAEGWLAEARRTLPPVGDHGASTDRRRPARYRRR